MRVTGWIFLAIGTASILLFGILAIGQGDIRPRLLSIGITAMILGGSLRASPKSLRKRLTLAIPPSFRPRLPRRLRPKPTLARPSNCL